MKNYALIGEHLSHSHSPLVHSLIFNEMKVEGNYTKIECSKEDLPKLIEGLRTGKYYGFNVTIPYKLEIMKYLDEIDDAAKKIGAVNTVAIKNGKVIGYNTDYYGFRDELIYFNVPCKNKNAYILGTGGASLAVYRALVDLGANVLFVSRNPKNDMTISYDELEKRDIDILVNATPVGMYPNVDESPVKEEIVKKAKYCLDLIFNPSQTKFLEYANSCMNGFYMLVGQAIKSEEIWQDKKCDAKIENLVKKVEEMI